MRTLALNLVPFALALAALACGGSTEDGKKAATGGSGGAAGAASGGMAGSTSGGAAGSGSGGAPSGGAAGAPSGGTGGVGGSVADPTAPGPNTTSPFDGSADVPATSH